MALAECEQVASHLESCPDCRSRMETISAAGDTMLSALRSVNEVDDGLDSGVRRVLDRIAAIGRDPSFLAGGASLTAGSDPAAELGMVRDYRLLAKLGEGGMGAVYKALHTHLEKVVALKILPAERLTPAAVARFQREMRAVGKLQHPNIVGAHDAGEHEGRHFLVMEHVAGHDLSEVVRRLGPLHVADACEIVRQAAIGLQHAHEHGLVHRDIKPSNLMLTQSGQVKILDLGLALLHEPQANAAAPGVELTGAAQMMGTADYMAPEQAESSHRVDIRADLYSLGCTLYKLLAGEAPFSGREYSTPLQKLMAHVGKSVPPIASRRADVPADLATMLDRLLAKRLDDRYVSPAEVAAAIAPFCVSADLAAIAGRADGKGQEYGRPALEPTLPQAATDAHLSSAFTDTTSSAPGAALQTASVGSSQPDSAISASLAASGPLSIVNRIPPRFRVPAAIAAAAAFLFVALGIVLSIRTPHGEVIVELGDGVQAEDVKIEVAGNGGLHIADAASGWTIDVEEGQYRVALSAGSDRFQLDKQSVTVTRNDAVRVNVTLRPVAVAGAAPLPPGEVQGEGAADERAVDRRAAEWALSIGGSIKILAAGEEREVRSVDELPTEDFQLVELHVVNNNKELTDDGMRNLSGLTELRLLAIGATRFTDAGLAHLTALPRLRALDIGGSSHVTDAGLAHVGRLTTLTGVGLQWMPVTNAGLEQLTTLKNLTSLALVNAAVDDRGLAHLDSFPHLVTLQLYACQVNGSGLRHLPVPSELVTLNLNACAITDDGLVHLTKMEKLKALYLDGSQITDAGLAHLERLPQLETISALKTAITDAGMAHLAKLPKLYSLQLNDTNVSDAGLAHLRELTNLTGLELTGTQVTDGGLQHLAAIQSLRGVVLKRTKVSAAGVAALQAALPECDIVWDAPEGTSPEPQWPTEERQFAPGEPLSALALVRRPAAIEGAKSWTVETVRHRGPIRAVGYSFDDKVFATAGEDGAVRVWDAASGQLVRALLTGTAGIWSLEWSPQDYRLAVGMFRDTCSMWDAASGRLVWTSDHKGLPPVRCDNPYTRTQVAWSPDGLQVAFNDEDSADDRDIQVRDSITGSIQQRLSTPYATWCLGWSPDGRWLVAGEAAAYVWDTNTWELAHTVVPEDNGRVRAIAFSPDGAQVAAYDGGSHVHFFDLAAGQLVDKWEIGSFGGFQFAPDGTLLGTAQAGYKVFAPTDRQQIDEIPGSSDTTYNGAAWRHDGDAAILGMFDGSWAIWDKATLAVGMRVGTGHAAPALAASILARTHASEVHPTVAPFDHVFPEQPFSGRIDWSADRARMVQADGTAVLVWDAPAGKVLHRLEHKSAVVLAAVSPDGRTVATADDAGVVRVWDAAAGTAGPTIEATPGVKRLLEILPDGQTLLVGGLAITEVWDLADARRLDLFEHGIPPAPDAATPGVGGRTHVWLDDQSLVVRGADNALRVFDCRELSFTREIKDVASTGRFAHDGRRYVWFDAAGSPHETDVMTGQTRDLAIGFELAEWSRVDGPGTRAGEDDAEHVGNALRGVPSGWVAISPDGHYRASDGFDAEAELVYVVETDRGQQTLRPSEFAERFGWRNDPEKVQALDLDWPEESGERRDKGRGPEEGQAAEEQGPEEQGGAPSPLVIEPEPFTFTQGAPVSPDALVARPAALPGLASWTLDTLPGREAPWQIEYSPDGKWFATVAQSAAPAVTLWDAKRRGPVRRFLSPEPVSGVSWSPDSRYLATTGAPAGGLYIIDAHTGRCWQLLAECGFSFHRVAWSTNGRLVAATGRTIWYLDPVRVAIVGVFENGDTTEHMHVSSDGAYAAVADYHADSTNIWHLMSHRLVTSAVGGGQLPFSAVWLGKQQEIATIGRHDGLLRVASPRHAIARTSRMGVAGNSLGASPDGRWIANCGGASELFLIDPATLERAQQLIPALPEGGNAGFAGAAAWSPDGRTIVAASEAGDLFFWRPTVSQPLDVVAGPNPPKAFRDPEYPAFPIAVGGLRPRVSGNGPALGWFLQRMAWLPDSNEVVLAYETGLIWFRADEEVKLVHPPGQSYACAVSPDGQRVATACDLDFLRIWDLDTRQMLHELKVPYKQGQSIAWSPTGELLATVGALNSHLIFFVDSNGEDLTHMEVPGFHRMVRFSPDGRRLAASHYDGLHLIDPLERTVVREWREPLGQEGLFAWLPDGRSIGMFCADGRLVRVDSETGETLGESQTQGSVGRFNRDGSLLLTSDLNGTIRVYSTATGDLEYTILYLRDDNWVVLSPDGHYRASPGAE
jgi:serine/threonine protein kinase/WD40 repeat protein